MSRTRKNDRKKANAASKQARTAHKIALKKLKRQQARPQWTYINVPVEIPHDRNLVDYVQDNIKFWERLRFQYYPDFATILKKTVRASLGIQTVTRGQRVGEKYEHWDEWTFGYSNFYEGEYELCIDHGPNRGDCDCYWEPFGITCDICEIPDGNYKSYNDADIIALLSQLAPGKIQVSFGSSFTNKLTNMSGIPNEVSQYFTPIFEPDGTFYDAFTFEAPSKQGPL